MVAGKKAVEMRYLVIALLALVGLGIAFVVFGGLASGAGGKANIQIGGANYSAPNVYDAIMGIGLGQKPCPATGEDVSLDVGSNGVCWSPPLRYGIERTDTLSDDYSCPPASKVLKVTVDLQLLHDEDLFRVQATNPDGSRRGIVSSERKGKTTKNDVEINLADEDLNSISFLVRTGLKAHYFPNEKGAVVTDILCSEVKPVDLQPIMSASGLFLDFDGGEKTYIEVGYENLGDPEASCEGGKLDLILFKYNTDLLGWEYQGILKTWQLSGTCEGTSAPYQFRPPALGIYSISAEVRDIENEVNTDNNRLLAADDAVIIAWKDRIFREVNSKASYASSDGQLWIPKLFGSSLYNSNACYILPTGRDNKYVLLAGSQIVKINNQDTKGTMALAVRTLSSTNNYKDYTDNIASLPPAPSMILANTYYEIVNSSIYYVHPKADATFMANPICGWYYDSNNNAGDNSGQNSLTIFALNAQPKYHCEPSTDQTKTISLGSGENTVCYWIKGEHRTVKSSTFSCPQNKIIQKIGLFVHLDAPELADLFDAKDKQNANNPALLSYGQVRPYFDGEEDVSNANAKQVQFIRTTASNKERENDYIFVKSIYCS